MISFKKPNELLQLYPNAKVVLSQRDSPQKWADSLITTTNDIVRYDASTIHKYLKYLWSENPISFPGIMAACGEHLGSLIGKGDMHLTQNADDLVNVYETFCEKVENDVSDEKLLKFKVDF